MASPRERDDALLFIFRQNYIGSEFDKQRKKTPQFSC